MSAGFGGNYLEITGQMAPISRYDEEKMFVSMANQYGVPITDADMNDVSLAHMNMIRRITSAAVGDGSPNDGFKVEQAGSPANNFNISGGDGTADGAGRLFVEGWHAVLFSDINYVSTIDLLHPQLDAISTTTNPDDTITDSSANWGVNALVGRTLCPDISAPATTFTITANTATTITVSASMTGSVAVGNYYRVNLSTPSGARTDKVYVDVFLDEMPSSVSEPTWGDSDLDHSIGAPPTNTECARRVRMRPVIRVVENGTHGGNYTDSNGQEHWVHLIATLARTATANINTAMITDERRRAGPVGANVEDNIEPVFEIVSTSGVTTSITPADPTSDFQRIFLATSSGAGLQIDYSFQGQMPEDATAISWIKVPLWGTGDYRLIVYAEGTGSVYDTGVTPLAMSGTRTVITVLGTALSAQPTSEKRYIVKIEAHLDNTEVANCGALRVRHS